MTTKVSKPGITLPSTRSRRNWFLFALITFGLLLSAVVLVLYGRSWFFAPPTLQPGDLLLLEPESIARVEAVAKAGDILAQSALGSAYLHARANLPKDVPKATYWLRQVADRDRSQFEDISNRMQLLLEKSEHELDVRKRSTITLDYLDLAAKRLAFEVAMLSLVEIYIGRHGVSQANAELAVKYTVM